MAPNQQLGINCKSYMLPELNIEEMLKADRFAHTSEFILVMVFHLSK